jgi:uncharacterized glyoxalase superfamily protein PhnB
MPLTSATGTIRELVPLLFVQDILRSAAFYQERLGFELTQKWEPDGKLGWCRLARDGSAVMLQQANDEDGPPAGRGRGVCFYFNCDDVQAIFAEITERGLTIQPPVAAFYGLNQVFVTDPDGYELCFQSACE